MNWDALGALAEVAGALAVFVTLVYLALQTRDNVKVMRSRAVWDAQVSFVEVNEILGGDGVIANVVYKAITDHKNLTDHEPTRFIDFAGAGFSAWRRSLHCIEPEFLMRRCGCYGEATPEECWACHLSKSGGPWIRITRCSQKHLSNRWIALAKP